ncbi:TIGR03862 family flavoprotein [Parvularcula marina]|uniref:TIGR03862 family flavoprotein n=1 Tax=Parvularcula marina TaxID=2292771 RepID=A0A371RK85_9PROT|nr:TIGR03862 family flavoprotein [Parvularcula marina]RFB05847.1 TIGR03862 family flavoprotein [Parvularcula marina]
MTSPSHEIARAVIIGAGPAGLMAAEMLTDHGIAVDIYDAMPSPARKFLMAGKSGLNITHTEGLEMFLARYSEDEGRLAEIVADFTPHMIIRWMEELGIEAQTGPTGRVFPSMMKASPLLRAWLRRLEDGGATLHTRHRWTGWDEDGALLFETPDGPKAVTAEVVIFALGGASWSRLGSDGAWAEHFAKEDIPVTPFMPSNSGFLVDWSAHMNETYAGAPVKNIRLTAGDVSTRAEFVITERGVESGGIYMVSAPLREALAAGEALLNIDLLPDVSEEALTERLSRPRGRQSMSNHLRKAARLTGVKKALLYEFTPKEVLEDAAALAKAIKSLPLRITGMVPLDEAISTTGGVPFAALTEELMLEDRPGTFCAGEMLGWDAPTGGYLLTACFATGRRAGQGACSWLLDSAAPNGQNGVTDKGDAA